MKKLNYLIIVCMIMQYRVDAQPYTLLKPIPAEQISGKLDSVNASFFQISDSVWTNESPTNTSSCFRGYLRNNFTKKNRIGVAYFVRSNKCGEDQLWRNFIETKKMLDQIPDAAIEKRDSIVETEYRRWIAFRSGQNAWSDKRPCFPQEDFLLKSKHDGTKINADSIFIVQWIYKYTPSCAIGLEKEVLLYKKNVGYIVLQYKLYHEDKRNISFKEASDLLDQAIEQTWGIIRFKNPEQVTGKL
ncbi:hypothetical protein [Niabella beijingensis]|uniref:hypothetical protein n=1 Tax=Niabella beijingensis TaxID=2872700 RepID=UPI001CBDFFAF|nr:hypothetical protein [Niabella beijingensis]MBZ4187603.1 hypothetical protein [Niabella beijingensis]